MSGDVEVPYPDVFTCKVCGEEGDCAVFNAIALEDVPAGSAVTLTVRGGIGELRLQQFGGAVGGQYQEEGHVQYVDPTDGTIRDMPAQSHQAQKDRK